MPPEKVPGRNDVAFDPMGFPIDLTRPETEVDIIDEISGGSQKGYETEYTIAMPGSKIRGGDPARWYLVPSIWDGEKRLVAGTDTEYGMIDEEYVAGRAASEMEQGWQFPSFSSQDEANKAAPTRNEAIGVERRKRNIPRGGASRPPVPSFGIPPGAIPPAPPPRRPEGTMSQLASSRRRRP